MVPTVRFFLIIRIKGQEESQDNRHTSARLFPNNNPKKESINTLSKDCKTLYDLVYFIMSILRNICRSNSTTASKHASHQRLLCPNHGSSPCFFCVNSRRIAKVFLGFPKREVVIIQKKEGREGGQAWIKAIGDPTQYQM